LNTHLAHVGLLLTENCEVFKDKIKCVADLRWRTVRLSAVVQRKSSGRNRQKNVRLFFIRVSTTDDVLMFWHINEFVYPTLSQLYLAMSASSIPVESMFSIAGLICNSRRSSLSPEKLHRVSFVRDNIKLITEYTESSDDI
jgi:hAT family C-terminal dimerisation region